MTKRISWKSVMTPNGHLQLIRGPGYWSNGAFALTDNIEIPKSVLSLKSLNEITTDRPLSDLIPVTFLYYEYEPSSWGFDDDHIIINKIKFQKSYIDAIKTLIPCFNLKVAGRLDAAIIMVEGVIKGLLMPVNGSK